MKQRQPETSGGIKVTSLRVFLFETKLIFVRCLTSVALAASRLVTSAFLLRFIGNSSTSRGSSTAPFLGELSTEAENQGGRYRRRGGRYAESAEPRGRGAPLMQNHSRDVKKDAASWSEVEGLQFYCCVPRINV